MNKISLTYKITSLFLLAVIVSHLFVFHFELEEKVLCIGDDNHFQIEKLSNSHLEYKNNLEVVSDECAIQDMNNCVDYLLDNHVDEYFAKINKTTLYKLVKIIDLNSLESNKSNISKNKNQNRYMIQKYIAEQFPTIQLLI